MRRPFAASIPGVMAALAFSFVLLAQTTNQSTNQTTKKADAPKSPSSASAPNLSGLWSPVGDVTFDPSDPSGSKAADLAKYPMTPWGLGRFKANKPAHGQDQVSNSNDPINKCVPPGVPRVYVMPSPLEIVQTADRLVMLFEYNSLFRIIYLDGREPPKDADPTYMGWSNGHWEADTLVVDATGFNGKGWLDRVGHPYSEDLQLHERFRRVNPQTLQLDITFHDPQAYTRDWTGQKLFKLHPEWHLGEYFCEDQYLFDEYQQKAGFGSFLPSK